eukprot:scaffold10084_cov139-Isochrysis_galbana.AAC.2
MYGPPRPSPNAPTTPDEKCQSSRYPICPMVDGGHGHIARGGLGCRVVVVSCPTPTPCEQISVVSVPPCCCVLMATGGRAGARAGAGVGLAAAIGRLSGGSR